MLIINLTSSLSRSFFLSGLSPFSSCQFLQIFWHCRTWIYVYRPPTAPMTLLNTQCFNYYNISITIFLSLICIIMRPIIIIICFTISLNIIIIIIIIHLYVIPLLCYVLSPPSCPPYLSTSLSLFCSLSLFISLSLSTQSVEPDALHELGFLPVKGSFLLSHSLRAISWKNVWYPLIMIRENMV